MFTNHLRRGALLLAAVGLTAGVGACGDSEDSSSADAASAVTAASGKGSAKPGNIVIADASIADNIDPDSPASSTVANVTIINAAYAGLVDYKFKANDEALGGGETLDASDVEPALAESWEASDSKFTFKLREGVKSTAGNEFTSADVKWAYDRALGLKATGAFIYASPAKITGVKVIDKYNVEFTTDGPAPMLLPALVASYVRIFDSVEAKKHATSSDEWATKWLAKNSAGFGAFDVTSFSSGKELTLAPSPTFYGGEPENTVKFLPIPDASSRYSSLEKGDVNIALNLSPQQRQQASKVDTLHLFRIKGNATASIYPHLKEVKAFADPKVRQALQYAMPQEEIAKSVFLGYAFPLKSTVPPYLDGYTDADWPYTYDIEKAKALMKEAGYENGFSVKLQYSAESATLGQLAPIVQASLEQIGIKAELVSTPVSALVSQMFGKKNVPAAMIDTGANTLSDLSNIGSIWGCELFANVTFYCNEAFDKAAAESVSSLDPAVRQPAWGTMQKLLAEDPPVIEVVGIESGAVGAGNISGYRWVPDASFPMANLKVTASE